jgi:hypothetical protein
MMHGQKNFNFVNVRSVYYFPHSLACQIFCSKKQVCRASRGFGQFPVLTKKSSLLHAGAFIQCCAKHDLGC